VGSAHTKRFKRVQACDNVPVACCLARSAHSRLLYYVTALVRE
jgi:hypothetical protein